MNAFQATLARLASKQQPHAPGTTAAPPDDLPGDLPEQQKERDQAPTSSSPPFPLAVLAGADGVRRRRPVPPMNPRSDAERVLTHLNNTIHRQRRQQLAQTHNSGARTERRVDSTPQNGIFQIETPQSRPAFARCATENVTTISKQQATSAEDLQPTFRKFIEVNPSRPSLVREKRPLPRSFTSGEQWAAAEEGAANKAHSHLAMSQTEIQAMNADLGWWLRARKNQGAMRRTVGAGNIASSQRTKARKMFDALGPESGRLSLKTITQALGSLHEGGSSAGLWQSWVDAGIVADGEISFDSFLRHFDTILASWTGNSDGPGNLPFHLWVPAYGRSCHFNRAMGLMPDPDEDSAHTGPVQAGKNNSAHVGADTKSKYWGYKQVCATRNLPIPSKWSNLDNVACYAHRETKPVGLTSTLPSSKSSKVTIIDDTSPLPPPSLVPVSGQVRSLVYGLGERIGTPIQRAEPQEPKKRPGKLREKCSVTEAIKPIRSLVLHMGPMNAVEVEYKKDLEIPEPPAADDPQYRKVGISGVLTSDDPMIWSIRQQDFREIQYLIHAFEEGPQRESLLNRRDKYGNTALHVAVTAGNIPVVEVLLFHGSNPNTTNFRNETPVHTACDAGRKLILKLLLQHGARIDIRNWQNKTCIDVADPVIAQYTLDYFNYISTTQGNTAIYSAQTKTCCAVKNQDVVQTVAKLDRGDDLQPLWARLYGDDKKQEVEATGKASVFGMRASI